MTPTINIYDFVIYDYDICCQRSVARLQLRSDEDEELKMSLLNCSAKRLAAVYEQEIKVVLCQGQDKENKRGTVLFSIRDS